MILSDKDQTSSRPFELIFGLGGFCQAAYQIEQYFGYRYDGPFDWIVAPLDAVSEIFRDHGSRFCTNIEAVDAGRHGWTALCREYGVAHHHDYPRNAERRLVMDDDSRMKSRSKMQHKYLKFARLLDIGNRVLFVRLGGQIDATLISPYHDDMRLTSERDINGLVGVIQAQYPNLDFEIAFVSLAPYTMLDIRGPIDPRVRFYQIEGDPVNQWCGSAQDWKPIFDSYDFCLSDTIPRSNQFGYVQTDPEILHP